MSSLKNQVFCPTCDEALVKENINWPQICGFCQSCEQDFLLTGYIEPPNPGPDQRKFADKVFQPLDIDKPRRLKLKKTSIPGVESFRIGGHLVGLQVRLEREFLVVKGLFGRERSTPIKQVRGFAALQHVSHLGAPGVSPGLVMWHLVAVLDSDVLIRIWEYNDRESARYVASELNKTLHHIRNSGGPYRG